MKIYSKKEIRDIVIALSLLGACLTLGYHTKQSQKQKEPSDTDTPVLTHVLLLTRSLPAGK